MTSILSKRLLPTIINTPCILSRSLPISLSKPLLSHFNNCTPTSPRSYSQTPANMSASQFLEAVSKRRTYYPLEKKSPIPDARIQEIIKEALLNVPSSFNSQSTRIVLLVKSEHEKFWDIAIEVLKGIVPADAFAATEQKLTMFKGAYASVLFFEDRAVVQDYQNKFATYADRFPTWSAETNGMHQYAVWTALEAEGLGANLQHYNPLVDAKVTSTWGIDEKWELKAQLVIGTPTGPAGEKTFKPIEERFKTFGA